MKSYTELMISNVDEFKLMEELLVDFFEVLKSTSVSVNYDYELAYEKFSTLLSEKGYPSDDVINIIKILRFISSQGNEMVKKFAEKN